MVLQGPAAAAGTVAGPITATLPSSVPDELLLTQGVPGVPEDTSAQTRGLKPAESVMPYISPSTAQVCKPFDFLTATVLDRNLMMSCFAGHYWLRHVPSSRGPNEPSNQQRHAHTLTCCLSVPFMHSVAVLLAN